MYVTMGHYLPVCLQQMHKKLQNKTVVHIKKKKSSYITLHWIF